MTKKTTQAENWVNDTVDYTIYKNGDLGIYGYRFKCKVDHVNAHWDFKGLCSVFRDGNDFVALCYNTNIDRVGSTPHEAAAKIAANTI